VEIQNKHTHSLAAAGELSSSHWEENLLVEAPVTTQGFS